MANSYYYHCKNCISGWPLGSIWPLFIMIYLWNSVTLLKDINAEIFSSQKPTLCITTTFFECLPNLMMNVIHKWLISRNT